MRAAELYDAGAGEHSWKCACALCVDWAKALSAVEREHMYLRHPQSCECAVCLVHMDVA